MPTKGDEGLPLMKYIKRGGIKRDKHKCKLARQARKRNRR